MTEGQKKVGVVNRKEDKLARLTTESGYECKPFYGPDDVKGIDYSRDVGNPGEFPYARGIYPEMYRRFLWLKSINTSDETSASTNLKFKKQIGEGQTGLRFGGDVPTCHGLDPDHPLAKFDACSNACPRWSLAELEEQLEGVDVESATMESALGSMWGNFCFYAQMIALFEKRQIPLTRMRLSLINDPINNHGFDVFPSQPFPVARRINADITEFSVKHTPLVHPFCPCGYDMGETGLTAAQDMAFIIANAIEFSQAAIERGLNFDDFAPRIAFSVHGDMSIFETVCKVRAARKVWARVARDRFKAQKRQSCLFRCGIRTAGSSLTDQQPVNNIARITLQVLGAALAGGQAIDACGYDEPFGIPSNEAETISLNVHHIVGHECDVALVADPLGGSYFVESLTSRIEQDIERLLTEIDELGGMYAAVESGWVRQQWEKVALEKQKEIEEGKKVVVGVNKFRVPENIEIPATRHTYDLRKVQQECMKRLETFKAERDQAKAGEALLELRRAAKSGENVVRPAVEAFKANATIKEVAGMIMEGMGYSYDFFNVVNRPAFLD